MWSPVWLCCDVPEGQPTEKSELVVPDLADRARDGGSQQQDDGSQRQALKQASSGDPPNFSRSSTAFSEPSSKQSLDDLPNCPIVGCSYAFLREFAESGGTSAEKLFENMAMHQSTGAGAQTSPKQNKTCISQLKAKMLRSLGMCSTSDKAQSNKSGNARVSSPQGQDASGLEFNMGTICNGIIKPRTKLSQLKAWDRPVRDEDTDTGLHSSSYAELGMQMEFLDSRGNPAFSRATHFASHAWKNNFSEFVEALGSFLEQNSIPDDSAYFWVDAFVVNQHQTQEYPQEWWSTRFMQAIGDIGNTVLVLQPWQDPVALKRAWVIWELYCTAATGARLHLAMSKGTRDDFRVALVDSFEKVQTALSRVDVSKSQAFHERDRSMIHAEIERTIGFPKLNELINTEMTQCLAGMMKGQLQEFTTADSTLSSAPGRRSVFSRLLPSPAAPGWKTHLKLKENLARMLRECGNASEAELFFKELLPEMELRFGADHVETLGCLNQLAVTLQKCGKTAEALGRHRDCLERRRQGLGQYHEDTLQSASNLAVLLGDSQQFTADSFHEARQLYVLALTGRRQQLGLEHPRTLYTMSNLGKLMDRAPEPSAELSQEAETLHAQAVEKLVNVLHEAHPLTLTARHNQACHWLACIEHEVSDRNASSGETIKSKKVQAKQQLHEVLLLRTEKLGADHPETLLTRRALSRMDDADTLTL